MASEATRYIHCGDATIDLGDVRAGLAVDAREFRSDPGGALDRAVFGREATVVTVEAGGRREPVAVVVPVAGMQVIRRDAPRPPRTD